VILRSLIAFSLLTTANSAPDYNAQTLIPVADRVAEAKAPREDKRLVDLIQAVNARVNEAIEGESDLEHYGIEELWVMYPSDGKGDCEDYALTKLGMLSQLGVPIVQYTKIVSIIVHLKNAEPEGHAILAIRFPHGTVLYLDNMNPELMTRRELLAQGYQFFDWKA
jgi:predicted transglutaminase-like cysteine proteinase